MRNDDNFLKILGDFRIVPTGNSVVADIFEDEFDITWHRSHKSNNPEQRVWGLIEKENAEDDGTVSYKYNNEYFRSDEFVSTHKGRHVLFAGCSETEGQGGDLEDAWGKILFNNISDQHSLDGYYSVGKSGYGWQKIINQVRTYIKKYGKPDNLFILLPNIGRFLEWSDELSDWYARQEYPNLWPDQPAAFESNMYIGEQTPERYKKAFVDFVSTWKLFEDFCIEANIKLVWGSWYAVDSYNFNNLNLFKNFVFLFQSDMLDNIDQYRKDAKLLPNDMNKRDGHHGRLYHEYWADKMLKEARAKGFLDD